MERKTQMGYLVLADISGITSFVARTEIEHAEKAISVLLEHIIEKMDDMLTIFHSASGNLRASWGCGNVCEEYACPLR